MRLNREQMRTQISSSHRLINLTSRIRHQPWEISHSNKNSIWVTPEYLLANVIGSLVEKSNGFVAQRITALLNRAASKCSEYNVPTMGVYELAAEALYDSKMFKGCERYVSRIKTRNTIKSSVEETGKVEIVMPIFSRKPLSPIKNFGCLPDIGEINSLLKFSELSRLISGVSGLDVAFNVLADGNKYRRACGTDRRAVERYQDSLGFWVETLGVSKEIKLHDYEKWVLIGEDKEFGASRELMYEGLYGKLSKSFDNLFSSEDIMGTMERISRTDLGNQIAYTFWSITTSVNYRALFANKAIKEIYSSRDIMNFYVSYISSFSLNKASLMKSHLFSEEIVGGLAMDASDRVLEMRCNAWDSAKRYVAISLVDRDLNTIFKRYDHYLKLTMHGKPGEYNFISTSASDFSRSAQHSTGGLKRIGGDVEIDYRYRIEREHDEQIKVFIKRHQSLFEKGFDAIHELSATEQPVYYVSE